MTSQGKHHAQQTAAIRFSINDRADHHSHTNFVVSPSIKSLTFIRGIEANDPETFEIKDKTDESEDEQIYFSGSPHQKSGNLCKNLNSRVVSREHAKLIWSKEAGNESEWQAVLTDLNSTHGTFCLRSGSAESRKLSANEKWVLKHGDMISFGREVEKGGDKYYPPVYYVSFESIPRVKDNSIRSHLNGERKVKDVLEEQVYISLLDSDAEGSQKGKEELDDVLKQDFEDIEDEERSEEDEFDDEDDFDDEEEDEDEDEKEDRDEGEDDEEVDGGCPGEIILNDEEETDVEKQEIESQNSDVSDALALQVKADIERADLLKDHVGAQALGASAEYRIVIDDQVNVRSQGDVAGACLSVDASSSPSSSISANETPNTSDVEEPQISSPKLTLFTEAGMEKQNENSVTECNAPGNAVKGKITNCTRLSEKTPLEKDDCAIVAVEPSQITSLCEHTDSTKSAAPASPSRKRSAEDAALDDDSDPMQTPLSSGIQKSNDQAQPLATAPMQTAKRAKMGFKAGIVAGIVTGAVGTFIGLSSLALNENFLL